jgi:hypothetical protein
MIPLEYFTAQNVYFIRQGISVLEILDDETYACNGHEHFSSGIGRHFRHVLDLYSCFTNCENCRIDYDARNRNPRIESDRTFAISEAHRIIDSIQKRTVSAIDSGIEEIEVSSNEGENPSGVSPWCSSSITRELQYLASHTVHHYALIALIYKLQGGKPPEDFGVAPSTLLYEADNPRS